jgi:hypothetical protein
MARSTGLDNSGPPCWWFNRVYTLWDSCKKREQHLFEGQLRPSNGFLPFRKLEGKRTISLALLGSPTLVEQARDSSEPQISE